MRDLVFIAYLLALIGLGFRRPFLFVLAYAYVDIVSPQQLSYYLLNSIPLSMIMAALAIGGWLIADSKKGLSVAPRQVLTAALLGYCALTTIYADLPLHAQVKWAWVWKSLFWSIFLPFTLRTRLRIEAVLLFMVLSASSIIIVGGIKTLASGGGYGALNLMVSSNSGLYEGSTISTVAIAIVPLILWLARFGTIYPPEWRSRLFAGGLIFACLLIPVGTEARTGLVCIAALAVLMLRDVKRRVLYLSVMGGLALAALPFLPQSFTNRMETISSYQTDSSAATRLAVWAWTWNYAQENPLGGGFNAYLQNQVRVTTTAIENSGSVQSVASAAYFDQARAYHSAFFEMLGEQGFPGLFLFLLIHGIGLVRMEVLRRRYKAAAEGEAWIAPLATALQHFQIIYLVGSLFVGIAFQSFVWMMIAVQIGFDGLVSRHVRRGRRPPIASDSTATASPLIARA